MTPFYFLLKGKAMYKIAVYISNKRDAINALRIVGNYLREKGIDCKSSKTNMQMQTEHVTVDIFTDGSNLVGRHWYNEAFNFDSQKAVELTNNPNYIPYKGSFIKYIIEKEKK